MTTESRPPVPVHSLWDTLSRNKPAVRDMRSEVWKEMHAKLVIPLEIKLPNLDLYAKFNGYRSRYYGDHKRVSIHKLRTYDMDFFDGIEIIPRGFGFARVEERVVPESEKDEQGNIRKFFNRYYIDAKTGRGFRIDQEDNEDYDPANWNSWTQIGSDLRPFEYDFDSTDISLLTEISDEILNGKLYEVV